MSSINLNVSCIQCMYYHNIMLDSIMLTLLCYADILQILLITLILKLALPFPPLRLFSPFSPEPVRNDFPPFVIFHIENALLDGSPIDLVLAHENTEPVMGATAAIDTMRVIHHRTIMPKDNNLM